MSDKRPWAKIDVAYMLNPKWFEIERILRRHTKDDGKPMASAIASANAVAICDSEFCHELAISSAVRLAREAHLASILYCKQHDTDGIFPVRAVKSMIGVTTEQDENAITALFEVGMWRNHAGGMAEVHDYLRHQTHSELTEKRREAGRAGAAARWQKNGKSHAVANGKSMAKANAEEKREEKKNKAEKIADAFSRPDILEVFNYFNESLKCLDARPVNKTQTSADAIRKLIDLDGRTVEQIKTAIDFAHSNDFWQSNILSPKSLRDKYDTLRLQAQRQQTTQSTPTDALWAAGYAQLDRKAQEGGT